MSKVNEVIYMKKYSRLFKHTHRAAATHTHMHTELQLVAYAHKHFRGSSETLFIQEEEGVESNKQWKPLTSVIGDISYRSYDSYNIWHF